MQDAAVERLLGGSEPAGGVFYLHGDDEWMKGEVASRLVELHLDPATSDFNFDRLRGKDVDVEQLASVLGTPPMMAEYRVVLLTGVEAFSNSKRARKVLFDTVDNPPPGLALVMVGTRPSGSRAKYYGQLEKAARSVRFDPLAHDDVPGWLMETARARLGVEMELEAALALGQAIGPNLGMLTQELDKLAGFVEPGASITRADVEAAGTYLPVQDRWAWFDLVGEGKFAEALETLPVLMSQGESGVGLVIGLSNHLLRIAVLRLAGPAALEQALPPHQRWLANRLKAQARGWTPASIHASIAGLRRADRLLKSAPLEDRAIIEEWLLARITESFGKAA
ncbi:MAG TPA: DNA polymerase III subunit delta [Longimicrobiales bacterium]|nr:DNA polymerase III subunit delta [Longimicrobiales bacterium]